MAYPESNGQTEVTNRELVHGLKIKLEYVWGTWVEELPSILYSFRMIPHRATREMPFNIVYGAEAILPVEVGMETARVSTYTPEDNGVAQVEELDLFEEKRMQAFFQMECY